MILLRKICPMLTLVLLFACSTSEKTRKETKSKEELKEIFTQEVRADFTELNVWVNLMPNSPNRFHISGIVKVSENFKYDINFIKLQDIVVQQNQKIIYNISPVVQLDPELSGEKIKIFRFSTTRGLEITPDLDIDKTCNLEFLFIDGSEVYPYLVDNVAIMKTY